MDTELAAEEWESMSEAERRAYNDAQAEASYAEMSQGERAQLAWECGS